MAGNMEKNMKRTLFGALAVALFTLGIGITAGAQSSDSSSLGDYARSLKKDKQEAKATAKVYDNDNLPAETKISVVGAPSAAGDSSSAGSTTPGNNSSDANKDNSAKADSSSANTDAKAQAASDDPTRKITPGQSREDRQKAYDAWKDQIDNQRKKIDQMAQEIDAYQHSTALPWPNNNKYTQGLAEKQKALDQARATLTDLEEQARKAGVPSSVVE